MESGGGGRAGPRRPDAATQALLGDLDLDFRELQVGSQRSLLEYSILGSVPVARKQAIVEAALGSEDPRRSETFDRVMGSMCGMAVGDGLGHMFEFLPAADTPGPSYFDLGTLKFHGVENTFGLKQGQWTDDASMGLCMADSLIARRGFDGSDMRVRFWCWWNCCYNNAFRLDRSRRDRHSVGLGGNISKSLSSMRPGEKPAPRYEARTEDAGNGSLMRFTPIALFFHAAPLPELHDFARESSYTTHPGIIAAEACSLLAHLISRALHRPPGPVNVREFLDQATEDYMRTSGLADRSGWGYDEMKWLVTSRPEKQTERCWNWKADSLDIAGTLRARGRKYNGYPVSAGYFGSYSMDGLAMSLWALYHTTSFDEAVVRSINLLGDADSHGSICGQIAGALYGYRTIHPQFLKWLNQWDEHEFAVRAVLLYELGRAAAG